MPTKNQIKAYKEVMEGKTGPYEEMLVKALTAYDNAGLTVFDFIDEDTWPDLGQRVLTNLGYARLSELSDGVAWRIENRGWERDLDNIEFWLILPEGFE